MSRSEPRGGTIRERLIGREPGLRALQVLAATALVVPAALLALYSYLTYREHFAEAQERMTRTLALIHEHGSKVFDTYDLLASYTEELTRGMSDEEVRASEADLNQRLIRLKQTLPQVQDVWVIDAQGRPLVTANLFPVPQDLDLSDRQYFRVQRERDAGVYVSEVLRGRAQDVSFFQFSRRRPSPDGTFRGVTAVSTQPDYFRSYYAQVIAAGLNTAALTRADGQVLARYPALPTEGTRLGSTTAFMQSIRVAPERGFYTTRGYFDNVPRMVAYEKLPGYPLYVSVGLDVATVRSAWMASLVWPFAFAVPGAVALFALTLLGIRHARRESEAHATLRNEVQKRKAAEDALRQSQKMEVVARLTAGVAHDFNNLLMIVQGSAEALRRKVGNAPRGGALVDAILEAAQRGQSLTRQLLAFSRRGSHQPVSFGLRERVPSLEAMLRQSTRGDIVTQVEVPEGTWPVFADPNGFEVALINLAVNARDAMPDGGRLTVRAANVHLAAEAREPSLTGDFVAITVRDTGTGIAEEHLERVFEPFFTTKEVGKGTGLGLAQVYAFATQSGGTVRLESVPGQGTAVTVYLPRAAAEPAAGSGLQAAPEPNGHGAVLIVEDNDAVAEATRALLSGAGFKVQRVRQAEEALAILERGGAVDVVLSDIVMPGMSGLELASRLRQRRPDLPIVMMTGYSEVLGKGEAQGLTVLSKPFREAELVAALVAAQGSPAGAGDPTVPAAADHGGGAG